MRGTAGLRRHPWKYLSRAWWPLTMLAFGALYLPLSGCATWQVPQEIDDAGLRARAVTETLRDVRLSAAVLGAADSRRLFGVDVNAADIQPVWVEVRNSSNDTLWLLRAGTDPDYFSPLEVAWSFHTPLAHAQNAAIDEHFEALDFENPIRPQSTRSGIIFTNPHHKIRVLNVDLIGPEKLIPFTLFLPDPDNPPDQVALQAIQRHIEAQREDLDDPAALRTALRRSPCCATGKKGMRSGDPLNVVLVGNIDDIAAALIRRGFRSDRRTFDNVQRLFGRQPDAVLRKTGQGGVPANWIRAWVAPFQYRGLPVLLGQTGRPIGGRFADRSPNNLVLHQEVDEVRNLLIQDLLYSNGVAKLGFVDGAGSVETAQREGDPEKNQYRTDGLRAVLFFAPRPRALSEVELLDWVPALQRREADAAAEQVGAGKR